MKEWPADKVERRLVADLVSYAGNSRTHSAAQVDQIVASIREWGWTVPVLVDEVGGIIAGHGRVLAAQKLGLVDVPCMVAVGCTEAQRRACVIAHNKLAANAGWDGLMFADELGALKGLGIDLGLTGFSEADMPALVQDELAPDGLTDDDAVPEVEGPFVSALGDVRICGDGTSLAAVA